MSRRPTDPTTYAERASERMIWRFKAIEERYLQLMGKRILRIGQLSGTDLYRLNELRDIGADMDGLRRRLSDATGKSLDELESIFLDAAKTARRPYDGLASATPYADNAWANAIASAQFAETAMSLRNLSNTTATSRTYQALVDEAVTAVQTGMEDYKSAMRQRLRDAAQAGLQTITYQSGHTRRLDSAMRQNLLDGTRALFQRATEDIGRQIGCDGVEVSAHMDCAEDHLPYQGRQYTNEAFQHLQDSLPRRIGQWNCRHHVYPILLGISEPAYTEAELADYRAQSVAPITIGGVTKTRYQWTQEQRKLETAIRREKDVAVAAKAAGDDVLRRECQRRINDYRGLYAQISHEAGLDVRKDRMSVSGFRAVKTLDALSTKPKSGIIITDKQIGKKSGKHMTEWGLDPSSEEDRKRFVETAREICNHPDTVLLVPWLQDPNTNKRTVEVKAYIRGNDVVLTRINGEYITTMKDGIKNKRVAGGRKLES